MPKTALVLRHIAFEDLGLFAPVLANRGYAVRYHDIGTKALGDIDPIAPDLLVVLGGPVGVYEAEAYPFLTQERELLRVRLAAGRPTLGICLGAQLIAATLGAKVAPTGIKEIGFSTLCLTDAGMAGPLRHLAGAPVLHWHGDAFAIPEGAANLASTPLCATQGFAIGKHVLALQFHAEVDAGAGIEPWLIGHAAELAGAGIDPRTLREQARLAAPALRPAAQAMFGEWMDGI